MSLFSLVYIQLEYNEFEQRYFYPILLLMVLKAQIIFYRSNDSKWLNTFKNVNK